eukprot:gene9287-9452_t
MKQLAGPTGLVSAGGSLYKVMQQVLAAQKQQQEELADRTQAANAGRTTSTTLPGVMELQVENKSWETSLVKCQCIIRVAPGHQQEQQQQSPALLQEQQKPNHGQEQHLKAGDRVYLMLQSKVAQTVDLAPGHTVRVYRPWFALLHSKQQLCIGGNSTSSAPIDGVVGSCPVVLAYLLTNA